MTDPTPSTDLAIPADDLAGIDLPPALAQIRAAIAASLDDLNALVAEGDVEAILVGIAVLDTIKRDLGVLRQAAGNAAADLMPDKMMALDGVGLFERKAAAKRTTDWDAILTAVRQRALVDTDTGEVVDDPAVAVARMEELVRGIVPMYRSTAAKQGGLSAAGIDKDSVQDTEWKPADVTFRAAK
jgi:hypothetical protein